MREVARIAALQAREPTPEPEPALKADFSGHEADYKRSPSPEPIPELFAREIARIREAEIARRDPSSTTTITVGDVTIKQQSKRADEEEEEVEERSLDSDGDDSSADLLSAELNRISGIAKAKREAEKADLLRREYERIAIVTSKATQAQGKREVVEFRRTEEGEELLRREIERIAGLQRRE